MFKFMKQKILITILIFILIIMFLLFNSWTKFISDDIIPIINEKIIVSQYDSLLWKEVANYYIDIKNEKATIFIWTYNSWSLINELDTKENYKILHDSKHNYDWAFYTHKSNDWKYLIFVARPVITKYWIRFHLWWWSLYIMELETWKVKQIYIRELNKDNKYISRIVWLW